MNKKKEKVLTPYYDKKGNIIGFKVPLYDLMKIVHDKLVLDYVIARLKKE